MIVEPGGAWENAEFKATVSSVTPSPTAPKFSGESVCPVARHRSRASEQAMRNLDDMWAQPNMVDGIRDYCCLKLCRRKFIMLWDVQAFGARHLCNSLLIVVSYRRRTALTFVYIAFSQFICRSIHLYSFYWAVLRTQPMLVYALFWSHWCPHRWMFTFLKSVITSMCRGESAYCWVYGVARSTVVDVMILFRLPYLNLYAALLLRLLIVALCHMRGRSL